MTTLIGLCKPALSGLSSSKIIEPFMPPAQTTITMKLTATPACVQEDYHYKALTKVYSCPQTLPSSYSYETVEKHLTDI